jgi:fructokinase
MSFNVIGIGEVLWDLMPDSRQLGGAPANFAIHARSLGANAQIITRVGEDNLGREILLRFNEMSIADALIQIDPAKATGTASVTLHDGGIPRFTIQEDVAWDQLDLTETALVAVRAANAVCFGTLAQRHPISRQSIQRLVAAASADVLRVFDINLRPPFYSRESIEQSLNLANVLKLNDAELTILAEMFELGSSMRQQIERLAQAFELRLVVLTRGPEGSLLYQEGRWSEQLPQPVQIVDTVGAGDAFTAALVMGLLNGMDLEQVHAVAAEAARYVCSHAGATPALPAYFQARFIPAASAGLAHPNLNCLSAPEVKGL